jgi:hypothetical protein
MLEKGMKYAIYPVLTACVLLGGVGCLYQRPTRGVSLELATAGGDWLVEAVRGATLKLKGWEVRILDSKVATAPQIPMLERLILEIVNTSPSEPLVLERGKVRLTGFTAPLLVGPPQRAVLGYNESQVVTYDPGLRAPILPYPFKVRISVHRRSDPKDFQDIVLTLY